MEVNKAGSAAQLNLPPGFRFHPTDEELVVHYLARRVASKSFPISVIAEVDLYKYDPWELPDKALFGEKEWYFFSPRDRKYPNGARPNRAAGSGYWKATGTDKPILSHSIKAGVKKALVFYKGRAPKGVKTNWIMHEYRLADSNSLAKPNSGIRKKCSLRLDDWVLCRIYKKSATSLTHRSIGSTLQQQQVVGAAGGGVNKLDADDESCLEEVLASLPDIDESRMCLPRLGSFTAMLNNNNNINSGATNEAANFNNSVNGALQQFMGRSPHQVITTTTATAAGSESGSGSVRSYNDSGVDNCLLDTRCNNLPSLRQQQEFYSMHQHEVKPSILFGGYNDLHVQQQQVANGMRGAPNRFRHESMAQSCEDEVESACKFVGSGVQEQFMDHHGLSRMKFEQQQQQQRHHNFIAGQLNGYYFQQS